MAENCKQENESTDPVILTGKESTYAKEGESLKLEVVKKMIEDSKNAVLGEAKVEIEKQIQASQMTSIVEIGIFASIISFLMYPQLIMSKLQNFETFFVLFFASVKYLKTLRSEAFLRCLRFF